MKVLHSYWRGIFDEYIVKRVYSRCIWRLRSYLIPYLLSRYLQIEAGSGKLHFYCFQVALPNSLSVLLTPTQQSNLTDKPIVKSFKKFFDDFRRVHVAYNTLKY